jgi:hypothetical protein
MDGGEGFWLCEADRSAHLSIVALAKVDPKSGL